MQKSRKGLRSFICLKKSRQKPRTKIRELALSIRVGLSISICVEDVVCSSKRRLRYGGGRGGRVSWKCSVGVSDQEIVRERPRVQNSHCHHRWNSCEILHRRSFYVRIWKSAKSKWRLSELFQSRIVSVLMTNRRKWVAPHEKLVKVDTFIWRIVQRTNDPYIWQFCERLTFDIKLKGFCAKM